MGIISIFNAIRITVIHTTTLWKKFHTVIIIIIMPVHGRGKKKQVAQTLNTLHESESTVLRSEVSRELSASLVTPPPPSFFL